MDYVHALWNLVTVISGQLVYFYPFPSSDPLSSSSFENSEILFYAELLVDPPHTIFLLCLFGGIGRLETTALQSSYGSVEFFLFSLGCCGAPNATRRLFDTSHFHDSCEIQCRVQRARQCSLMLSIPRSPLGLVGLGDLVGFLDGLQPNIPCPDCRCLHKQYSRNEN